jgi:hypothetical protein
VKKLLAVVLLAASLGGCATQFGTRIESAIGIITSASVSPTQIIVASNAFDAGEASATQYLLFCKANPAQAICALKTRQTVVSAVRAGRAARNQLEPYVTSGQAGPIAIYNTLVATVTSLQNNIPANPGASK